MSWRGLGLGWDMVKSQYLKELESKSMDGFGQYFDAFWLSLAKL